MSQTHNIPNLLTVKESADKLRVCPRTIYRWIADDPSRLKASKVGQQWLIPSTSISAMFDQIVAGRS